MSNTRKITGIAKGRLIVNLFEQLSQFAFNWPRKQRRLRDIEVMRKVQTERIYAQIKGESKREHMVRLGLISSRE